MRSGELRAAGKEKEEREEGEGVQNARGAVTGGCGRGANEVLVQVMPGGGLAEAVARCTHRLGGSRITIAVVARVND